jgi:hypothetical protein
MIAIISIVSIGNIWLKSGICIRIFSFEVFSGKFHSLVLRIFSIDTFFEMALHLAYY